MVLACAAYLMRTHPRLLHTPSTRPPCRESRRLAVPMEGIPPPAFGAACPLGYNRGGTPRGGGCPAPVPPFSLRLPCPPSASPGAPLAGAQDPGTQKGAGCPCEI